MFSGSSKRSAQPERLAQTVLTAPRGSGHILELANGFTCKRESYSERSTARNCAASLHTFDVDVLLRQDSRSRAAFDVSKNLRGQWRGLEVSEWGGEGFL